jgi:hypothetical protein
MTPSFLRKWHRWIGFPAGVFLILVSITGVLLAFNEFFGEAEAQREATRDLVSPVTTSTADGELASALAKARAAVAAQAPGAPMDKVEWQFKGGAPSIAIFTGKPGGGEDRKFIFNTKTGVIDKVEAYVDKPFLLRLHSGEAFGDGGLVMAMFWGLALLLLSVSGLWIYWQMRRRNATGLKKVFWLIPLFIVPLTRADSPFYTDDPEFSPGWEIKAGFTSEHNIGGSNLTEVLDWNYAIVPNVRLNLTTYGKDIWPTGGGHEFGYGDTEFKLKWRFQDADPKTAKPSLGIAPKIYFPTADQDRGLGDGVWRFQLPLQFGKTIGKTYHFAEAGYQWAFDSAATDMAYGGYGILHNFTDHWAFGTELFGWLPVDDTQSWQLVTTLGLVYTFSEHLAIKASVSHSLRDVGYGGPNPSGVFYLVFNF